MPMKMKESSPDSQEAVNLKLKGTSEEFKKKM